MLNRSAENYVIWEAKLKLKEYLLTPPWIKYSEMESLDSFSLFKPKEKSQKGDKTNSKIPSIGAFVINEQNG